MRQLVRALDATGSPGRFMVELTEEAFFAKGQFQSHILPMLREIGTGVSIDDFGVGYSSLSALADVTADEIKVDRSFVASIHQRPRNQSILRAIESLGAALDMAVLVEGVETVEELTYLQAATRIRFAQGFYFARPMFLEDVPLRGSAALPRQASAAREVKPGRPPARWPQARGGRSL
jgi:EAL domain-containing protein (putative c-di-GMP-specific phosphodiesterase class I)